MKVQPNGARSHLRALKHGAATISLALAASLHVEGLGKICEYSNRAQALLGLRVVPHVVPHVVKPRCLERIYRLHGARTSDDIQNHQRMEPYISVSIRGLYCVW
jgi:hypothetical protein